MQTLLGKSREKLRHGKGGFVSGNLNLNHCLTSAHRQMHAGLINVEHFSNFGNRAKLMINWRGGPNHRRLFRPPWIPNKIDRRSGSVPE